MNDASSVTTLAAYTGMLLAGLGWSLHCIGMCGPILIGFAQAFERAEVTVAGRPVDPRGRRARLWGAFACYHAGRIWTYAMLGLGAGFVGTGVRHTAGLLGMHRAAAIAISLLVIAGGIALLGVVPGGPLTRLLDRCGYERWGGSRWFGALVNGRGPSARLLLGAVMGFLPCGAVYVAMAAAAALPTPVHAAGAMLAFGIGTLPALSLVFLGGRLVPARLRAQGTRIAAVFVVLVGIWMLARTFHVHEHGCHGSHGARVAPARPAVNAARSAGATAHGAGYTHPGLHRGRQPET